MIVAVAVMMLEVAVLLVMVVVVAVLMVIILVVDGGSRSVVGARSRVTGHGASVADLGCLVSGAGAGCCILSTERGSWLLGMSEVSGPAS